MFFEYRDISIYYEIIGKGKPVLMIHGWGPDHRLMKGCMEPIFKSTGGFWKRIYFDLPGMGCTAGKSWINGTDKMLEVILEFIDGIIPGEHYAVAGESYGGYLARGIINKRPDDVDGLLLICPVANQENQRQNAEELRVFEKDESLLKTLTPEDLSYFESINVIQNKKVWEKFNSDILPGLKNADGFFLEKYLGQNVPFSFNVDKLGKPFDKPALMLTGRQDCAVGYRDHWKIMDAYPRMTFAVLDKAGHNLQIEQEEIFNILVREWLDRMIEEKSNTQ